MIHIVSRLLGARRKFLNKEFFHFDQCFKCVRNFNQYTFNLEEQAQELHLHFSQQPMLDDG